MFAKHWTARLIHVLLFVLVSYFLMSLIFIGVDIYFGGRDGKLALKAILAMAAFGPFGLMLALIYVTGWRRNL